jgi:biopolymer transport protein TolR
MAVAPIDQSGADGGYRPLAEINVTPFVDVMLVLLIVFMVAAPLMTVGVNVALPKTSAARTMQTKQPLAVSIDAEGRVYIDKAETPADLLAARLAELRWAAPDRIVLVRGDRTLSYGRIMEVMGEVSKAGFAKVSLIAEGRPADPEK